MSSNDFFGLEFGDSRLSGRCLKIAQEVGSNPALSFPRLARDRGWLKGLYRFFANPKVTREKIMAGHIRNTVERCFAAEVVLAIQDTTFLDYSHHPASEDLGLISGAQHSLGMGVHNVFAVSGQNKKPLGILHQEIIVRAKKYPAMETYAQRQWRPRESQKWLRGLGAVNELLGRHPKVIIVGDREADIYFFLRAVQAAGRGFVIRCAVNRRTTQGQLLNEIAGAQLKCVTQITLPRNGKRKKLRAELSLSSCVVQIKAPRKGRLSAEGLTVNVVVVQEINPPVGVEPLHWILLTSEAINSQENCLQVLKYYQMRWLIEDFHKGLKTGCQIENRQLTTRAQLEKVLGLFSVMVAQILLLRFWANQKDLLPEENVLSNIQIEILKNRFPRESGDLRPQIVLLLLARLGGFIGRKADGSPGWLTLMRGMYDLLLIEQGVILGQQLVGKG